MAAPASGRSRRAEAGRGWRTIGKFGVTRTVVSLFWLFLAVIAGVVWDLAGGRGVPTVVGTAMVGAFVLLAARATRLGYRAAPQGLVVAGIVSTTVIPWADIRRVGALPGRLASHGDVQAADLVWVAHVHYGPVARAHLFTARGRVAAGRLADSLLAEIRARR
jgi:hypothetical protein